MKRLLLSLFVGVGASFVGWASSFSFVEIADIDTERVTNHEIVIVTTLLMLGLGLIWLRSYVEPIVTITACALGTAGSWQFHEFPQTRGFSPEYWAAVTVSTLIMIALVAGLQSDYIWARRRHR